MQNLRKNMSPFILFSLLVALPASGLTISAGSYESSLSDETTRSFSTIQTRLLAKSNDSTEIANISHCQMPVFCGDVFLSRRARETTKIVSDHRANLPAISRFLDSIAELVRKEPKNARFGENDSQEVVLLASPEMGQELDKPAAVLALRDAIETGMYHAVLPVRTNDPALTEDAPDRLGFRELVAEGTTDFTGSTTTRIHNINRALEQYEGLLIAPGEEFSFVEHLGEVDSEHGYLPELVIKYDRTEPDYGGGICQVSSTLFRAAINAGLKITARKNHAYPVHYYKPYGMDATVYIPAPDLRFVNNTPGHLLIQSEIVDKELTFRLYGTHDGRSVEVDGPHILESNPDGSMKTIFSQTVKDASGGTIITDDFPSNYKSPDLFPHPEDVFTEKPDDWSKRQWREYLAEKNPD
jgi:vancomycin resistance protein YoaR